MAYEVIQINENTWRIEDNHHVRFFLLTGKKKALLVDSGMTVTNARNIAEELTDLPVELIITHGDMDHVASNHQFSVFYMHPSEASNYYNVQGKKGEFIPVENGDIIDLGERKLEIIHMPGHTPGSIGILDEKKRFLISGDPIQDGMIFMFGEQREMHAYRKTLKKLDKYRSRFDEIYPSHGSFPIDPQLIDELYEKSEKLLSSSFEYQNMEFFGRKVKCADVGAAKYLLE